MEHQVRFRICLSINSISFLISKFLFYSARLSLAANAVLFYGHERVKLLNKAYIPKSGIPCHFKLLVRIDDPPQFTALLDPFFNVDHQLASGCRAILPEEAYTKRFLDCSNHAKLQMIWRINELANKYGEKLGIRRREDTPYIVNILKPGELQDYFGKY